MPIRSLGNIACRRIGFRGLVRGSVRGVRGDEHDGSGTDLASLVSEPHRRATFVDHDHLVDRMRVQRDSLAGRDDLEDHRDRIDPGVARVSGIDEHRPARPGPVVVGVALVEGHVVELLDDCHPEIASDLSWTSNATSAPLALVDLARERA